MEKIATKQSDFDGFAYTTVKYSANSLETFAVVDLLLAIFVRWLAVKFLSLRRYEKVTQGTSIRPETLEKLPDERVTGQQGSTGLYGPEGELPRRFAWRMSDGGVSIHHWLAFSSRGWCNLDDISAGMGTILLRYAGNIFRASKAAAGYRMLQQLYEIVNRWGYCDYIMECSRAISFPRNFRLCAMINIVRILIIV